MLPNVSVLFDVATVFFWEAAGGGERGGKDGREVGGRVGWRARKT